MPRYRGGSEGAKQGTLSIMVGGSDGDVTRVQPVLAAMGNTITHIGPVGSGQLTKAITKSLWRAPTGPWPRVWLWG
jgi:3-hydroxyisobutyrate dehydrogenase